MAVPFVYQSVYGKMTRGEEIHETEMKLPAGCGHKETDETDS